MRSSADCTFTVKKTPKSSPIPTSETQCLAVEPSESAATLYTNVHGYL